MREEEFRSLWPHPIPQVGNKFFQTDPDPERKWLDEMFASTVRVDGYMSAAAHLFNEIQRRSVDGLEHWLVYPMYFLYRHAIELSLKEFLCRAECQSRLTTEQKNNINRIHNLTDLWKMIKPWAQTVLPNTMSEATNAFEAMLDEITERDPDGQGGRYQRITDPKDKKNKNFMVFANITPLRAQAIRDGSVAILNFLQHIRSHYGEQLQSSP